MRGSVQFWVICVALTLLPAGLAAQTVPTGYVSVFADYLPNRSDTAELRTRLFAEEVLDPSPKLLITASAFVEALAAKRSSSRADAIVRLQQATMDFKGDRVEVFAGFGTVAWGRLDELQPTDVINPLDVSRFFFEGRGEARMPVGLARARLFISDKASVEAVYVPFFRRGRFDQLDEPTSPFNIASAALTSVAFPATPDPFMPELATLGLAPGLSLPLKVQEREPAASIENSQGGARFNATVGRLDWSVSAYSGIEPFALYRAGVPSPAAQEFPVDAIYPRFTMIGGDFETVAGEWGVRGEVARFVRDNFQSSALQVVKGSSMDAGVGVDRKAGEYRISGTVLLHRERYDTPLDPIGGDDARTDVSLIASADRFFARERYQLRTFGVYNPSEGSGFLRSILMWKPRDQVGIEFSGGWFIGEGRDLIGRFRDSDFVYARAKYYF